MEYLFPDPTNDLPKIRQMKNILGKHRKGREDKDQGGCITNLGMWYRWMSDNISSLVKSGSWLWAIRKKTHLNKDLVSIFHGFTRV